MKRYDAEFSSLILLILTFCVLAFVFTCARGADVMFYAGFPMLAAVLCCAVSFTCVESFMAQQTERRLLRKKAAAAVLLLRAGVLLSALWALAAAVLLVLLSDPVGEGVFGSGLTAPLIRSFAPAIALSGISGCLKGFLKGIGQKQTAQMIRLLETIIFLSMGLLLGFFCAIKGESIGALLRNEDMSAVYCGCGIALGLDLAEIISCIILAALCRLYSGRLRPVKNRRDAFLEDEEPSETMTGLMRYMLQKILPGISIALMLFLGLLISYRFWLTGQEDAEINILISEWGGFMGVSLPVTAGCILLSVLPQTGSAAGLVRDQAKGRFRTMRARLTTLLKLSAYIGIPCAAFLFGAAGEIVAVVPGLTFKAQDAAVLTLRAGSFLAALGPAALLMLYFFWNTMCRREAAVAAAAGFFVQIILIVVLDMAGSGICLSIWTLDAFVLVFLTVLYVLGLQGLIRGFDQTWMTDAVLMILCSVMAVVPIALLSDYLLQVLPSAAALLLSLLIFAALYIILSILLRAADLHNLSRLPGGYLIVALAVLLGVADREEN